MKSLTQALDFQLSARFIFQQKSNGRDILKGSEIEQERLDLANEMKAMTQSLSDDVLESLPNEKDLELVNPKAIHEFVNKHLKGEIGFDEAEIKKVVVKRRNGKMTVKIKRKGFNNDIIIKINDKKDKVKIRERRKGKDLKIKYKKEEFKKEKQPIHKDIDFSMTVDEYKEYKNPTETDDNTTDETVTTTTGNTDVVNIDETVDLLPEVDQETLYNELKGKINALSVPGLDKVISDSTKVGTLQAQIDALQKELNDGKSKMTPERGLELQGLLDVKQAALTKVKKQAEVYSGGEKVVENQDNLSKKEKAEIEKKIKEHTDLLEKEQKVKEAELKKLADDQAEAFEKVRDGQFKLEKLNFDPQNLETREGVATEFVKYQNAAATFEMEANVLASSQAELGAKWQEFEESKSDMSSPGSWVKSTLGLAALPLTLAAQGVDWGMKLFGSNKTVFGMFGQNKEVDKLTAEKDKFVSGFEGVTQELDIKRQAIDAHGNLLEIAVTTTLPGKLNDKKAEQSRKLQTAVDQLEASIGEDLPANKVAQLKLQLENNLEATEGAPIEALKTGIVDNTNNISGQMEGITTHLTDSIPEMKEIEFEADDAITSTLGFVGKGIAKAGDWMVEGSDGGWWGVAQVGGVLGGVVRGAGHLIDGVSTIISKPHYFLNGLSNLAGFDFINDTPDHSTFSIPKNMGTAWKNMFKGFFATDAWERGEYVACVSESAFNILSTIVTGGGTGGARAGAALARGTFKASRLAGKGIIRSSLRAGGKFVGAMGKIGMRNIKNTFTGIRGGLGKMPGKVWETVKNPRKALRNVKDKAVDKINKVRGKAPKLADDLITKNKQLLEGLGDNLVKTTKGLKSNLKKLGSAIDDLEKVIKATTDKVLKNKLLKQQKKLLTKQVEHAIKLVEKSKKALKTWKKIPAWKRRMIPGKNLKKLQKEFGKMKDQFLKIDDNLKLVETELKNISSTTRDLSNIYKTMDDLPGPRPASGVTRDLSKMYGTMDNLPGPRPAGNIAGKMPDLSKIYKTMDLSSTSRFATFRTALVKATKQYGPFLAVPLTLKNREDLKDRQANMLAFIAALTPLATTPTSTTTPPASTPDASTTPDVLPPAVAPTNETIVKKTLTPAEIQSAKGAIHDMDKVLGLWTKAVDSLTDETKKQAGITELAEVEMNFEQAKMAFSATADGSEEQLKAGMVLYQAMVPIIAFQQANLSPQTA